MLNTCANPNCCEPFRYLRDGKLFRLQTDVKGSSSEISNPEYFWLCARCAKTLSLRLTEDGEVVVTHAPATPDQVAQYDFIPLDRQHGLLLGCLHILRSSVPRTVPLERHRAAHAS